MMSPSQQLDELTTALEDAARQLRSGELDSDDAAGVVDDCARLAARAAGELERVPELRFLVDEPVEA